MVQMPLAPQMARAAKISPCLHESSINEQVVVISGIEVRRLERSNLSLNGGGEGDTTYLHFALKKCSKI